MEQSSHKSGNGGGYQNLEEARNGMFLESVGFYN